MIPHIHTLFEFISIPYENQHQTLNIKKIDQAKSSFESIQLHYCNIIVSTIQITVQFLSNFTYKLLMIRGGTLLILGSRGQWLSSILFPYEGMTLFALSSFLYLKKKNQSKEKQTERLTTFILYQ